ncbi:integumentary mucin C.1-like [Lytechinus variegatus]|uniref:integumentary mucin C.1-like n=1 Tax=Lytechinus variegatus TaxID=7654 RepID=UPI001BB18C22|nr:integumentary mucin C.1-like [Lytechinus variegatus]
MTGNNSCHHNRYNTECVPGEQRTCVWTAWINDDSGQIQSESAPAEEVELLEDARHFPGFPRVCDVFAIQCRTVDTHVMWNETDDAVTVDVNTGLRCINILGRPICRDYECRWMCCSWHTVTCTPPGTTTEGTTTTPETTTVTTTPETTTVTTTTPETTTRTTTTVTSPEPTPSTTTECVPGEQRTCVWTAWINDDSGQIQSESAPAEEVELLEDARHFPGFPRVCDVFAIQCRTVDTHVMWNETDDAVTVDVNTGLRCINILGRPICRDYECRWMCCSWHTVTCTPPGTTTEGTTTTPETTTVTTTPETTTVTTTTPETTTRTTTTVTSPEPTPSTTTECVPGEQRTCVWTAWINDDSGQIQSESAPAEEVELLEDARHFPGFPRVCDVFAIQCRTVDTHVMWNETDDAVTVDVNTGLRCINILGRPVCRDYECRWMCCSWHTVTCTPPGTTTEGTTTTPETTTVTTTPETTTVTTTTPETTTRTTTTVTSPEPPPSTTTECVPGEQRTCVWTAWINDDSGQIQSESAPAEEVELLEDARHFPGFPRVCDVFAIQCRTVDTHVMWNETDDAVTVDVNTGLRCINILGRPICRDYECRWMCCSWHTVTCTPPGTTTEGTTTTPETTTVTTTPETTTVTTTTPETTTRTTTTVTSPEPTPSTTTGTTQGTIGIISGNIPEYG